MEWLLPHVDAESYLQYHHCLRKMAEEEGSGGLKMLEKRACVRPVGTGGRRFNPQTDRTNLGVESYNHWGLPLSKALSP